MMATMVNEEKMEKGDIEMPAVDAMTLAKKSSMMNDGIVHTLEWHVESYTVGKDKRVLQNIGMGYFIPMAHLFHLLTCSVTSSSSTTSSLHFIHLS